jgi:hypothetical protein
MRGFRNFLLRGDVIVIAVGLVVALAFVQVLRHRAACHCWLTFHPADGSGPGLRPYGPEGVRWAVRYSSTSSPVVVASSAALS